ncbi:MAG: tripartite tricarboxylate transporter substrate binding protein [Burkholderiales bacterium]|nr:tripartite tricarboxylate transporter substrate binding protein [Burkholderiales bacterium]
MKRGPQELGISILLLVVSLAANPISGFARDYPARPIRIIDPYPPGGATDFMDRIVSKKLSESVGQPVIVDNRPGAGGNLAAELAARATPDGYTLHMNLTAGMASGRVLFPRLAFDIRKDFAYVTLVAEGMYVLVAHPALSVGSLAELVALAKAKGDQLRFGSAGIASPPHLAFELLKTHTGTNMVHVPYKGAGPLVGGLTGGEVQLGFVSPAGASSLVKAGRLTALAVSSARRAKSLPTVPTVAEAGYPGFDVAPRYGYMVPAGTPGSVVKFLNIELGKILAMPDLRAAFETQGLEATSSTPERMREIMLEEETRWAKLIKDTGIKAE